MNTKVKIGEIVDRMRALPEDKQNELLDRLIARQRNAELLSEMNLQAAARVGLILRQLQNDMTRRYCLIRDPNTRALRLYSGPTPALSSCVRTSSPPLASVGPMAILQASPLRVGSSLSFPPRSRDIFTALNYGSTRTLTR